MNQFLSKPIVENLQFLKNYHMMISGSERLFAVMTSQSEFKACSKKVSSVFRRLKMLKKIVLLHRQLSFNIIVEFCCIKVPR